MLAKQKHALVRLQISHKSGHTSKANQNKDFIIISFLKSTIKDLKKRKKEKKKKIRKKPFVLTAHHRLQRKKEEEH